MIEIITAVISSTIGAIVSFLILKMQLREKKVAFLSFEKRYSIIKNIGDTSALNVSIYRITPNLDKKDSIVSLIHNIKTIKVNEEVTLNEPEDNLPIGHYDYYILQFLCLNGKYYHQIYQINTGRGDAGELRIPVKVFMRKTFPTYSIKQEKFFIPRKIRKLTKRVKRLEKEL
ncbi:hypothetical protein [Lactococcus lactis]|uniref:hypothetical protein n=1 Tax=Lactococcus lactis TaxID=1358 RepID=UPI0023A9CCB3|nr:hypothetical protein [Lactococcus lactis]WEA55584.1 hypothetical protein PWP91_02310 [Lactococcus lactis]